MNFNVIDIKQWPRKPYFEHYTSVHECTYSMTLNVDVSLLLQSLRARGLKFYPAFIYMVTRVVNERVEFRTSYHPKPLLGYWDSMTPSYTYFHHDDQTFSCVWTEFSDDFSRFHNRYEQDMERYRDVKGIFVKENPPPNTFFISMIPWASFRGFNLNMTNGNTNFRPIITGGKFAEQGGRMLLPIALQVHHAVCDGYHASLFFQDLQTLADSCNEWL